MCSGRVDLSFVLRAFMNGMDGVFIGGCRLNECHYITDGNYHALGMVLLCKRLMRHVGLNPERLRIEGVSSGEGIRFAEIMNEFAESLKHLGPLGKAEGVDEDVLKLRLAAIAELVPYIRLVERERLRVPVKSEEAYKSFYAGEEMDRLFNELIADKLAIGQIRSLLEKGPLSTRELSEKTGLSASDLSRHVRASSKHGLVRYDSSRRCYSLV